MSTGPRLGMKNGERGTITAVARGKSRRGRVAVHLLFYDRSTSSTRHLAGECVAQVRAWLTQLGLTQYVEAFERTPLSNRLDRDELRKLIAGRECWSGA
jgi:hypothetical protein